MNQVQAGGEVAPLVGAAEFQRAVVFVKQVEEVVALQHLVAELGEGDAFLRVQAAGDRVLGEHGAQTEVLADVTQEVDDGHRGGPIVIGHETYGVRAFGVQNAADLVLQTIGPAGHHVLRVERAFAGLARVADESGGAADQGDWMMARKLQVTHVDELHEVADMQRCSSGVEAAIIGDGLAVQCFCESIPVRGLGNQPAPFQFLKQGVETRFLEVGDVSHSLSLLPIEL